MNEKTLEERKKEVEKKKKWDREHPTEAIERTRRLTAKMDKLRELEEAKISQAQSFLRLYKTNKAYCSTSSEVRKQALEALKKRQHNKTVVKWSKKTYAIWIVGGIILSIIIIKTMSTILNSNPTPF